MCVCAHVRVCLCVCVCLFSCVSVCGRRCAKRGMRVWHALHLGGFSNHLRLIYLSTQAEAPNPCLMFNDLLFISIGRHVTLDKSTSDIYVRSYSPCIAAPQQIGGFLPCQNTERPPKGVTPPVCGEREARVAQEARMAGSSICTPPVSAKSSAFQA